MSPDQLKLDWQATGETLERFPESAFANVTVPPATKQLMVDVGLPSDAAPCLSFGVPKSGRLVSAREEFDLDPEFDQYYTIGSNGSGDPVVMRTDGVVLYLNHDNRFLPVYINKDVATLFESLVRFRRLIAEAQRVYGPDAYLDGRVPQHLRAEFCSYLREVDGDALADESMWAEQIAQWTDEGGASGL